jgi:hypothetical protein
MAEEMTKEQSLDLAKFEIVGAAVAFWEAMHAQGGDTNEETVRRWDAMMAANARLDQALARRDAKVAGK